MGPAGTFYTLSTDQSKAGLVIWGRYTTRLGKHSNCGPSLPSSSLPFFLSFPFSFHFLSSLLLTLLCSAPVEIFTHLSKQTEFSLQFPRQTPATLFLSNISFCLLVLILPVYGSVLLQGFIANRKNNIFPTFRY